MVGMLGPFPLASYKVHRVQEWPYVTAIPKSPVPTNSLYNTWKRHTAIANWKES